MKIKRLTALLLAGALVVLPACGGEKEANTTGAATTSAAVITTENARPEISERVIFEEFKDDNGKVCFTLDIKLPGFEGCRAADPTPLAAFDNNIYSSAKSAAATYIANSLATPDSPRTFKCDYEITSRGKTYISFCCKSEITPKKTESNYSAVKSGATFSTVTGSRINIIRFSKVGNAKFTTAIINNCFTALKNAAPHADNCPSKQLITQFFDPESFYITEDSVNIVFPDNAFSEYQISTCIASIPIENLEDVLSLSL